MKTALRKGLRRVMKANVIASLVPTAPVVATSVPALKAKALVQLAQIKAQAAASGIIIV